MWGKLEVYDENLSIINKTKHLKKGEKKGRRWKDPTLGKQRTC
jgi:hypothetical protein